MALSNAFRVSSPILFLKLKNPRNGIRSSSSVSNFMIPSSNSLHSFKIISIETNNQDPTDKEIAMQTILVAPHGRVGLGLSTTRDWEIRESRESLLMKINMPGFGKEDVQITFEKNSLRFEGEAAKEFGNDDEKITKRGKVDIPPGVCDIGLIEAEIKDGILKLLLPKAKPDAEN